jgi:NADH:ubiquinone oxidoreductase subunit 4 (subunit M)
LWYFSFVVVFTTIGFPGTSIFFAKFVFLSVILSYSYGLFLFFIVIFFMFLPLFFVRLWVPIWFGLHSRHTSGFVVDLTGRECALIGFSCLANIVLGVAPTLFFGFF